MELPTDVRAVLAETEARYRHLVESASDGIYRTTTEGYFTYANPIANRVLGGGETIVGHHYLEFVRPDYHDDIQRFYYQQVRDKIPSTYYEFPAISRDGTEVWIGQRTQIELDSHGMVVGFHAVARDISDRRRLEDALRQSDKMRVVGQLAGGIAHDFNSLVTAICGYADLLIQALGPDDPRTADAVEIRRSADKAARLTSQLLTFSRRELFRVRIININQLLTDARPMLLQLLGPTITCTMTLDDSAGEIRGDVAQLEQALFNLTLNARDAMPQGGEFHITTTQRRIAHGELAELNLYPGHYVVITVRDTGRGMDEATRGKIFEPFFTTKPSSAPAGLGLATTFGAITGIGGRITVESQPGKGSTFKIYLPRVRSADLANSVVTSPLQRAVAKPIPQPMNESQPSKQSQGVVLLVDDEDGIRHVLARVLELNGFEVISANNGADALAKAKEYPQSIDVVLTDILMPKMSGFDLVDALSEQRPNLRTIFMSGYADQPDVRARTQNDNVQLLAKPFDSASMLRAVRTAQRS